MLAPPTRTTSGITLRPISHGSLELLRQLNNSLATAEADMGETDTRTLTEFLWVHGAPIDEVLDTVYNYVHQYGFPILPQNLIHRPRKHAKKLSEKGSLTITYWPKVLNNALNTSMTGQNSGITKWTP